MPETEIKKNIKSYLYFSQYKNGCTFCTSSKAEVDIEILNSRLNEIISCTACLPCSLSVSKHSVSQILLDEDNLLFCTLGTMDRTPN